MRIGLRIDVDTLRGTGMGVPNLCAVLADHSIKASFFFCVGPDNMGRHLWRLLKPSFLIKTLRTRASKLYGWDILLKGTFWPGPVIGDRCARMIRAAADAGHETGFHAWDHHAWQSRADRMRAEEVRSLTKLGCDRLAAITGKTPCCSAVPAWKCTDETLSVKEEFPFVYNSDCRGSEIFLPVVNGRVLRQPQVPVTLPTYDEMIGSGGVTDANYNDRLRSYLRPDGLNVLTIHAEVEGIACLEMFRGFLKDARSRGDDFVTLGMLSAETPAKHVSALVRRKMPGREGWLSWQETMINGRRLGQ